MKEWNLRKIHRRMGIALALFILLQVGSGVLISLRELDLPSRVASIGNPSTKRDPDGNGFEALCDPILRFLHIGGGPLGAVYRIALGMGTVGMAFSGTLLFLKIRARAKRGRDPRGR